MAVRKREFLWSSVLQLIGLRHPLCCLKAQCSEMVHYKYDIIKHCRNLIFILQELASSIRSCYVKSSLFLAFPPSVWLLDIFSCSPGPVACPLWVVTTSRRCGAVGPLPAYHSPQGVNQLALLCAAVTTDLEEVNLIVNLACASCPALLGHSEEADVGPVSIQD